MQVPNSDPSPYLHAHPKGDTKHSTHSISNSHPSTQSSKLISTAVKPSLYLCAFSVPFFAASAAAVPFCAPFASSSFFISSAATCSFSFISWPSMALFCMSWTAFCHTLPSAAAGSSATADQVGLAPKSWTPAVLVGRALLTGAVAPAMPPTAPPMMFWKALLPRMSFAMSVLESKTVEGVLVQVRVVGVRKRRGRTHDSLRAFASTVRNLNSLRKDLLIDAVTAAIVNRDSDLLHDKHDRGDVVEAVAHVAATEQVVQVIVEAVVDLVDNKNLIDLLHDDLAVSAVIDDLQILLLNLDHLLLLVEVVEAVDEVEASVSAAVAVDDSVDVVVTADDAAVAFGLGRGDGLCSCS
jgi:hypothetical protein